jgi:hypothetical protein
MGRSDRRILCPSQLPSIANVHLSGLHHNTCLRSHGVVPSFLQAAFLLSALNPQTASPSSTFLLVHPYCFAAVPLSSDINMPVTIRPTNKNAATTTILPAASPIALFRRACTSQRHRARDNLIIQPTSTNTQNRTNIVGVNNVAGADNIVGVDNAFIFAVVLAYDGQHHLNLRPDDVPGYPFLGRSTLL